MIREGRNALLHHRTKLNWELWEEEEDAGGWAEVFFLFVFFYLWSIFFCFHVGTGRVFLFYSQPEASLR